MRTQREVILVIDDNVEVARFLALALAGDGFSVLAAETGEEGLAMATVHTPDLILLDLVLPDEDGFEVCRCLARDISLRHIPVIAMTGHEDARRRLSEILDCIDDYMFKPFDSYDLETRIKLSLRRARTMTGANPLTKLPGNVAIQEELIDRVDANSPFALLYIDLDEFKSFNDHYGFLRGDEAIKLLARCIRDAVVAAGARGPFVGHIGGDDFAAIVDADVAQTVAAEILRFWDELAPNLYEPEDMQRGYIELTDRRGHLRRHPMVGVSIGIATNASRSILSHWEAAEVAAEMKAVAKARGGSAMAIDRRRRKTDTGTTEPVSV